MEKTKKIAVLGTIGGLSSHAQAIAKKHGIEITEVRPEDAEIRTSGFSQPEHISTETGEVVITTTDKGTLGAECQRTACKNTPALYWNKSTRRHYCKKCSMEINDFARGRSYELFGAELCQLDESLTPERIKELEELHNERFPFDPPSEEMDNANLIDMPIGRPQPKYFDFNNAYQDSVNTITNPYFGLTDFYGGATREEMKYAGKAVAVSARPVTKRNDPCPCTSGKKFKNCCQNKPKMV